MNGMADEEVCERSNVVRVCAEMTCHILAEFDVVGVRG